MSAIYGIVGDAEGSELERMGERLAHRGSAVAEWSPAPRVLFGQRVRDENGSGLSVPAVPVAFDGFIDNRTALAETLGLRPEEACDDATLVFAVYRKLGPDGLSRIRGQFGVAIYDAKRRHVVSGSRPLGIPIGLLGPPP